MVWIQNKNINSNSNNDNDNDRVILILIMHLLKDIKTISTYNFRKPDDTFVRPEGSFSSPACTSSSSPTCSCDTYVSYHMDMTDHVLRPDVTDNGIFTWLHGNRAIHETIKIYILETRKTPKVHYGMSERKAKKSVIGHFRIEKRTGTECVKLI